jgi:hypothetical protein
VRAAEALVADGPTLVNHTKVLLPHVGLHLGVGFVVMQLAAVLCAAPLVTPALRWVERLRGEVRRTRDQGTQGHAGKHAALLAASVSACRRALGGVREVIRTSDRAASPASEEALRDASASLSSLLTETQPHALRAASVVCLQLRHAIENALRIAERAPEHGFSITGTAAAAHERMHAIADATLASLTEHLSQGSAPSLEDAQAREIELNAIESETRRALWRGAQPNAEELPALLWSSELIGSYEAIGNQIYRLANALRAGDDELD